MKLFLKLTLYQVVVLLISCDYNIMNKQTFDNYTNDLLSVSLKLQSPYNRTKKNQHGFYKVSLIRKSNDKEFIHIENDFLFSKNGKKATSSKIISKKKLKKIVKNISSKIISGEKLKKITYSERYLDLDFTPPLNSLHQHNPQIKNFLRKKGFFISIHYNNNFYYYNEYYFIKWNDISNKTFNELIDIFDEKGVDNLINQLKKHFNTYKL